MQKRKNKVDAAKIAREKYLTRLYEVVVTGADLNQTQLGAMFGRRQQLISRDLKIIRKRIEDETDEEMKRTRAVEGSKWRRLFNESLKGLERSQKNTEEITTVERMEKCGDCGGTGFDDAKKWCVPCGGKGEVRTEVQTRKVTGQAGDPKWIRECVRALTGYAKLFGLNLEEKKGGVPAGTIPSVHIHTENKYLGASSEAIIAAMEAMARLEAEAVERRALEHNRIIDVKVEEDQPNKEK